MTYGQPERQNRLTTKELILTTFATIVRHAEQSTRPIIDRHRERRILPSRYAHTADISLTAHGRREDTSLASLLDAVAWSRYEHNTNRVAGEPTRRLGPLELV